MSKYWEGVEEARLWDETEYLFCILSCFGISLAILAVLLLTNATSRTAGVFLMGGVLTVWVVLGPRWIYKAVRFRHDRRERRRSRALSSL